MVDKKLHLLHKYLSREEEDEEEEEKKRGFWSSKFWVICLFYHIDQQIIPYFWMQLGSH